MRIPIFISCLLAAGLLATSSAESRTGLPSFTALCPGNLHVDSNGHGGIRFNGTKTRVRKFNENYYEATLRGVTVSVDISNEEPALTYTAKGGANGVCTLSTHSTGGGTSSETGAIPTKDEQACLLAVTRETNNGDVVLLNTETSQAADVVTIGVGPQRAIWRCLVKNGQVSEVTSMTDEGAL